MGYGLVPYNKQVISPHVHRHVPVCGISQADLCKGIEGQLYMLLIYTDLHLITCSRCITCERIQIKQSLYCVF